MTAGRGSGDLRVDIRSKEAIDRMFRAAGEIDACICVAESGAMDDFETLTDTEMLFPGMNAVPMDTLVDAYTTSVEGTGTGEIVRVYR